MVQRFVGERRAIATLILAFIGLLFFMLAMFSGQPQLGPVLFGLAAVYLVGMFALAAGYFWARWYTMGVMFSGFATSVIAMFQIGAEPVLLVWGGVHGLALLALIGRGPASVFDGRKDWRERYRMDDVAANRLGKAITRAGASLPYLVQVGLAPRQGMALVALGLGALGVSAIVRMRTWGLFALAGSAALLLGAHRVFVARGASEFSVGIAPWIAGGLLLAAVAPFAPTIARRVLT